MHLKHTRLFLVVLIHLACAAANAQTLYWIGGSGNYNDPKHWSITSGGAAANKIPNATTDVVFDNAAAKNGQNIAITFSGENFSKKFLVVADLFHVEFKGNEIGKLNVSGDFKLNNFTKFNANTNLVFSSEDQNTHDFSPWKNKLKNDVTFKKGNWNFYSFEVLAPYSLSIEEGTIYLMRSSVKANNIFINKNHVNIVADKGTFFSRGKVNFKGVSYGAGDLRIIANFNDKESVQIEAPASSNLKYSQTSINAGCVFAGDFTGAITGYTASPPSCPGACDASLVITISTLCVPGSYTLNFNTISSAISDVLGSNTATNINVPTYTLGGLCSGGGNLVDVSLEQNGSVIDLITNQNLPQNLTPIGFFGSVTNFPPNCPGQCTGSQVVRFSGGTSPYTVEVNPLSLPPGSIFTTTTTISNIVTNLCGGIQSYSITDKKGCTTILNQSLTTIPNISITASTQSVACNGGATGIFSVSVLGGTPNYSVIFSSGSGSTGLIPATPSSTVSSSGLFAGAVTATVTDSKGCTSTRSVSITQPASLTAVTSKSNVTCGSPAPCDGVASVTVSGGSSPYTYSWSSGGTTSSLTGLCGGNYTVNIVDNHSCTLTPVKTFTIIQPSSIVINSTVTNLSCVLAGNTGSIIASPSGGNGTPYTFSWSPTPPAGQSTGTVTGLGASNYSLTVKDASLCATTQVFTISTPPTITITPITQSVVCRGQSTGAATAIVTGGNGGPYTYTWNTIPVKNTQTVSGLAAGNYTVSITDITGCQGSVAVTIAQPPLFASSIITTSLSCNGINTGSIVVNTIGGVTPSFTLASSTATLASASGTFTSLSVGNYTILISDASLPSCSQSFIRSILQPSLLVPSISTTSITCFSYTNGILVGSASGGVPSYTYNWNTPTGTISGISLSNRGAGNYTLTITDGNGCVKTKTTTLTQPSDVTVSIVSTSVTCVSNCNGALSASVSGGTPGYTLNWSNGFTSNPNTSLCAGNYTLNVTDTKGCVKTTTAAVLTPSAIALTQSVTPVSCAGFTNGTGTVTAGGGTAPFLFQINTSPVVTNTTGIFTGLGIGTKIVSVADNNGCTQAATLSITSPAVLSAAITGMINSCTSCTGASTVTAAGGNPGYSYTWKNVSNTTVGTASQVASLCQGNYSVTVSDTKSCTAIATVSIGQIVVAAAVSGGTGIQCFGNCTGSVVASPSGGTAPYTYTWSSIPAQNTPTATGLCAGSYTVTIKESSPSGCTSTAAINVVTPSSINVVATSTNVTCSGAFTGIISTTATGGTGTKSYSWSPGGQATPIIAGIAAGTYTLYVKDGNNCAYTPPQTFTITQPSPIAATYATSSPSACTASNGSLCATVSGGNGSSYTYSWTPGGFTTSCLNNIPSGSYNLIVKDAANCTTTLNTSLSNPVGPTLTPVTQQSVTCFGGNNGAATFSATGASPFSFTWSPTVPTSTTANSISAINLSSGIFNISLKDVNNCVTIRSITIGQASQFTIVPTITNQKCNGGTNNGTIAITPSGGTPFGGSPSYSFTWSPGGSTLQNLSNVASGNYTLLLKDANNCTTTSVYSVSVPSALSLTATSTNSVLCGGICNGAISSTATGGAGGLSYSWTPVGAFTGSTTTSILNLCPNTYSLNVKDANNCVISKTVQLLASTLSSSLILQNATCSNSNNAVATHSVSGGTPSYTYAWTFGASTSSVLSNLGAGNYTAMVTDANGCSSAKGFTVTLPAVFSVVATPSNPKCNSASNGSITTFTSGAQGSVNYNWLPTGTGQNPTGLNAGTYTLTATDANLCQALSIVTLTNPPVMLANVSFTDPLCNGNCNGIAKSTATNAIGAVSYTWLPMGTNSSSITNLCGGSYSVIVKDANQCQATQTFTLTTPISLTVNFSSNPASCGTPNGSITAIANGGTPIYNFSWLPAGTGSVLNSVSAGLYTVTVTDANSCSVAANYALSNANGPTSVSITTTDVACNSASTGVLSLNVSSIVGGTPNYTVSWILPSSATTAVNPLTNLPAGNYTSKIVDANSCELYNSITINEPSPVSILPNLTFPTCNGTCNGAIILNVSGGTTPYSYTWSAGASSSSVLTNACAGNYTILIGSGVGGACTNTQNINLPNNSAIAITSSVTPNSCFGNSTGSVSVLSTSGGIPPFLYSWNNGQTSSAATNLSNGSYSVIVSAANGCHNTFTFNISSPPQITASTSVTQPSCNLSNGGSTISALGGIGPFTYTWTTGTTGQSVSNLGAGLYQVVVKDAANNCTITENVSVNNSNGIASENFTLQNILCAGINNGSVTVSAVGGNPPVNYNWINPVPTTGQALTNLGAGIYFVQMTDAQGCVRTSSTQITAATSLSLSQFVSAPTCGSSNGSVSVIASGGTPSYSYSWTPSAPNSPSLNNIGASSYTLNVTDANNCLISQNINVSNTTGPAISFTQNNINCFGSNTGSVSVTAAGAAPINYKWSNNSISSSVSNLPAGVISLTVTDGNGCETIQSFTITENPILQLNPPQTTQPTCSNSNGSATVIAFGGTIPYTYSWTTGAIASNVSGLSQGIYQVKVSDALGCESTKTVLINNINGITAETFTVQNLLCSSVSTGAATVSAIGGTSPINYQWLSPAVNNSVITNQPAGIYFVQMTDAQNCSRTASVEITAATTISVSASVSQPSCGANNGSIILAVTGGTPNYSFSWLPGSSTSSSLTNINTGSYTVTISDSNPSPCPVTQAFNISNGTGPAVTYTQTDILCAGANTGSIVIEASGSGAPYAYQWSTGSTSATLANISAGVITLTTTATGNGCTTIKTFTVSEPSPIQINTPLVNQPTCNQCNGSATISPFGGTIPYVSYTWSAPTATGATASNLCAGFYNVNVTDANGCAVSQTVIINNSNGITGANFNTQNLACANNHNGSATVIAVGGTQPVTYQWLNPALTNSVISNLSAGVYSVQMTDAQNCVRIEAINITASPSISILASVVQPNCGVSDGSIHISVAGGTPTYSFSWLPAASTLSALNNINTGIYTVTVTDGSPLPCPSSQVFNISNSTGPVITFTQSDVKCFSACTGSIGVTATGNGTLAYHWSNGAITPTVSNLCSGIITLTVTDVNSCATIKTFTINENPPLQMNTAQVVQPSCNLCNGSSTITAFGGIAPYTYSWSTGTNSSTINNLCAGIYQLVIKDALNCQVNNAVVINNSNGITGQNFNAQNLTCGNVCNGSVTVTPIGGTQPITYQWLNSASSNSVITNLCVGVYSVQMTDAQSCVRIASVEILGANNVSVTASVSQPSCGASDGSIVITAVGGTLPYSFLWLPGAITVSSLTNIDAGSYTVTVTDSNPSPCPVTQVFNISNSTSPAISFTQTDVQCAGATTGSIVVEGSGANPPFTYQWNVGSTTPTVTNLGAGSVILTVTDNNSCAAIKTFTVTEPSPIQINAPLITQPSCNLCNGSATISPFGGTLPYTSYVWSTPAGTGTTATNLCAGLYQVNITDATGCVASQTLTVNNSNAITGETFNVQNILCTGNCNGAVTVTANGGTSPITYNWINPAVTSASISNLCAGSYYVQMVDAAGCIRTSSVTVAAPVTFSIHSVVAPPTCGSSNGIISVQVSGGTPVYTYIWSNGTSTTSILPNVGVGTYSVKVIDGSAESCALSQTFNISNYNGPSISFSQTDIDCYGLCSGAIAVTATGTNTPYTYTWSAAQATTSSVSNLCSGVITLTVSDVNTCKTINSFTITENPPITASLPNVIQPHCNNGCDGQITLIPSGGTLPYTSFSWSPSGYTSNPQPSLCAGSGTETSVVYTITITDAKGCTDTTSVRLINPTAIALTPTVSNASCSSANDAFIAVSPSGGIPSYTLSWTGPSSFTANTASISNLFFGSYSLNIIDAEGCTRDTSINITTTIVIEAIAGNDTIVCPWNRVNLNGINSIGSQSYSWYYSSINSSPISTTAILNIPEVDETSMLILKVVSPVSVCFDLDTVMIYTHAVPFIDAGPTHSIVVYDNVTIGGNPTAPTAISYSWAPSATLSNPNIANPIASNTLDVTYTITVVDANGCVATAETSVLMFPAVRITSGFSPNGDGKNDTWIIDQISQYPDNTIEIYNRWGELLFSSKGYQTPFDGRYNGKDLPVGTYYYIITLNHPAYPKPYTGPVTIFR